MLKDVKNWYQIITDVKNWYLIFTDSFYHVTSVGPKVFPLTISYNES